MTDPWSDIPRARGSGERTLRRADPDHPLDFFRGRDGDGRYLFILEKAGGNELPKLPTIAGIELEMESRPDGVAAFLMKLVESDQVSIFRVLCHDLLDATKELSGEQTQSGTRKVIQRLIRWQEMLKRSRQDLLSRQKIIGLVGELLFLRDRALKKLQPTEAAASWRGPYGDEQDFAFGERIIEIKTQLSTADQALKISSEAQLDTASGPIILCHQTLAASAESQVGSRTLNELVRELHDTLLLQDGNASDVFEAGLIAFGYIYREEYDAESWLPVNARFYEVLDGFPRLVPDGIPPGVSRLRYQVLPEACAEYERSDDWVMEFLFHD